MGVKSSQDSRSFSFIKIKLLASKLLCFLTALHTCASARRSHILMPRVFNSLQTRMHFRKWTCHSYPHRPPYTF